MAKTTAAQIAPTQLSALPTLGQVVPTAPLTPSATALATLSAKAIMDSQEEALRDDTANDGETESDVLARELKEPTPTIAPAPATVPVVVSISLPLGYVSTTEYVPRQERAEVKSMTRKQSLTLKRLRRGLEDRGEKLEDGSTINSGGRAIRWLLEQISISDEHAAN